MTSAVHGEGGKIVLQLWHVGVFRIASLLPDGAAPVSSTDRVAMPDLYPRRLHSGFKPRALRDDEIPR